jgi:mannonate dehydratase
VRIAVHPDDPPVPSLGGVAHVLRDRAAFDRLLGTFDSPALALNFCVGTWSEMAGVDALEALRTYLASGRVAYLHLRDVRGEGNAFRETWIGEGDTDALAVLGALLDSDFDGFLLDDHTPALDGDHIHFPARGHAHATGWIQGALAALRAARAGGVGR